MSEQRSNKLIKPCHSVPEELVVQVSSFLPIRSLFQYRTVSKLFTRTEIRSLDLDFSGIFSVIRTQPEVINIIQSVFNRHEGLKINRFVLYLSGLGGEESVASWINTCIRKNIQELVLDFSGPKRVKEISIDFSAIETLTVLSLRWCRFRIPNNTPKGLKFLRTLSLMRTTVTSDMTVGIFSNCLHLESLELIECYTYGVLKIPADNHKKFKTLVLSCSLSLSYIVLSAPTLEYFKYDGYVLQIKCGRIDALKEAYLHYKKSRRSNCYISMNVVSHMKHCTQVSVLSTTSVLLEALTKRYVGGGRLEKNGGTVMFQYLTDFKISFKPPTICTLFDIVEFIKYCPKLLRVEIDFQNFTFEPRMLFWKMHQKGEIENNDYLFPFLNEVKIIGFKGHWHEIDIVKFFVKNAPSLVNMELVLPKRVKCKAQKLDAATIISITSISPAIKVVKV